MLCEVCKVREAMVHLTETQTEFAAEAGVDPETVDLASVPNREVGTTERHLCEQCADQYFASTPGMNSSRNLICLSDAYRERLLDKIEKELPEAFYDGKDHARLIRIAEKQVEFLRRELKREGIPMEGDALTMLWGDLFCGWEFYERRDRFNRGDESED